MLPHPLGCSSGVFSRLSVREAFRVASSYELDIIELMAMTVEELDEVATFAWMYGWQGSIHAPAIGVTEGNEAEIVQILRGTPSASTIVVHADTIINPRVWWPISDRLVIENMDSRKEYGQTPAQVQMVIVEAMARGLCLDISHAFNVGGRELFEEFMELNPVHFHVGCKCGTGRTNTPDEEWAAVSICRERGPVVLEG